MVTYSIETELDIPNGACRRIVDIILKEDSELANPAMEMIQLTRSPTNILVKMDRTQVTQLEGLDVEVLPIQPMDRPYTIKVGPAKSNKTVHRCHSPSP